MAQGLESRVAADPVPHWERTRLACFEIAQNRHPGRVPLPG